MKRTLNAPLFVLLLTSSVWGQHPRTPGLVELTLADPVGEPTIDSDGDLMAIAFGDGGSLAFPNTIRVSTSDGRGIVWSPPVRIDGGPAGSSRRVLEDSVQVLGNSIYVLWLDDRSGTSEAYLNRSYDGGLVWQGEGLVRNGFLGPLGTTNDARIGVAADPLGGPDRVYVLMNTQSPAGTYGALFLTVSYDGGATFGVPFHVPGFPLGSGPDVDEFELCVEAANALHIVWKDDRIGGGMQDVYYRKFNGAALLPGEALMNISMPGSASTGMPVDVASDGMDVLVAWHDNQLGVQDHVRYNVSADGGMTWMLPMDAPVGGYALGVDLVSLGDVHVDGGRLAIAYKDNRTGSHEATVAVAPAGPVVPPGAWVEHRFAAGGHALAPRLVGSGDYLAVSFRNSMLSIIQAAVSHDGGLTFEPEFTAGFPAGGDDYQELAFNELYGNFGIALIDILGHLHAGGFRAQTLSSGIGLLGGGMSVIAFSLTHFGASESGDLYIVLLSTGLGFLPLPDGRDLGLGIAGLVPVSTSLAFFSGTIDGAGAGVSTLILPGVFPAGVLQCVGITVGIGGLGSMTDVELLL